MWDLAPAPMKKVYEREVTRLRTLNASASRDRSRDAEVHLIGVFSKMFDEYKQSIRMAKATLDRLELERNHWFRKSKSCCSICQL
jgi:hypothetical protein